MADLRRPRRCITPRTHRGSVCFLRSLEWCRYVRRLEKKDDYALLPASDAVDAEGVTSVTANDGGGGGGASQQEQAPRKEGLARLAFWRK